MTIPFYKNILNKIKTYSFIPNYTQKIEFVVKRR